MSSASTMEVIAYVVLVTVFLGALRFVTRSSKRANEAAPSSAVRTPRQQLLNKIAALLPLPALVYFAFLSELQVWPIIWLGIVFVVFMFALRLVGFSWRVRVGATPIVATVATFAGALTVTWPSLDVATLSGGAWLALAVAAVSLAASGVLSILSFPIGHGERSV
jgi:hypothetical protein